MRFFTFAAFAAIACTGFAHAAAPVPIVFQNPQGGEIYFAGQQATVRLDPRTKAKKVTVELSRDGGTTFVPVGSIDNASKDKSKRNVLSFPVAAPGSNHCLIRASAGASVGLSSEFTIAADASGAQPGSVMTLELADGSVTNPKLAQLAVSSDKVTSGQASNGMVLIADGLGNAAWGTAPPAPGFSGVLAGDVTGTQNATLVAAVGGVTAANVASGANAANAATTASMPNTIVKRDANGNIPGAGGGGPITLAGDVTGPSGANNVAIVGGVPATNVADGASLANAATSAATPNTIVKRDASGNFAGNATNVTGIVPIAHGGTGSPTQTFVDLSNTQTVGGNKTFLGTLSVSSTFAVEPRPANTGANNFFAGTAAGAANTTGASNTFVGSGAGSANTAPNNTFIGFNAGSANTAGHSSVFVGASAGSNSTGGLFNTFVGLRAGQFNTGSNNTFMGNESGGSNQNGNGNSFFGASTGIATSGGSRNSLFGANAGFQFIGSDNAYFGFNAGQSLVSGSSNIAIGASAGNAHSSGDNNIDIGNTGVNGNSGTIRVGTNGTHTTTFIAGIRGATVAGGVTVMADANGQLGTIASSQRFKSDIHAMGAASDALLKLRPVTFVYKRELDPVGIPQFGLIAEEVAAVNPDLIARDDKGDIYTVRYEAVNAMLLNEFLKEHKKVEAQEQTIAAQQKELRVLSQRLEALSAQVREIGGSSEGTAVNAACRR